MGDLILPFSMMVYVVAPLVMLHQGWLKRAALTMIGASLLPWAVWIADSEPFGPGAGFALLITLIQLALALLPMLCAARAKLRKNRQSTGGSTM